jgi:Fe-S-cluster containining protein
MMSDKLPCSTCHADCCGIVPLSAHRLAAIEKHLASVPAEEYAVLKAQKRGKLTCAFVDTRNWTCAVYPVRPALCEIFGRTEGAECPHHPQLVNIITRDVARMRVSLDGEEDDIVALSHEFVYAGERSQ